MLTLRVCGSPLNCLEYNQIGDMVAIGSQNGNSSGRENVINIQIFHVLFLVAYSQDPFICLEFLATASRTSESIKYAAVNR